RMIPESREFSDVLAGRLTALDVAYPTTDHAGSAGERFTDFFPIVVNAFTEHLREAHSPMWVRG
ncbi:hypothetical protein, partial [Streptomyces sp. Agncl-13]|uniref:hypothetical protein n=1 Tax=Streptomyces sp. Agncl-13 TaxID=3400628 RepID=UPI003A88E294